MPTTRLLLRRVRPGDEHQVYDLLSDMRVVRHMLFPIFTLRQAGRFVEAQQGPAPEGDPRQEVYGIAPTDSGDLLGLCGLVFDPSGLTAEIWYALAPDAWGHGYATEASHQLVHQAFTRLGLHRIWASCLPLNPASSRVLEKLGFRLEGRHRLNLRIHGEWHDSYTYALLSSEWDPSRAV